jgi:hypothetical protein
MDKPRDTMSLFTIHVEVSGEEPVILTYRSVVGALEDGGLKTLFADGVVANCSIHVHGQRVTARPITTRKVLMEQLVSNATTLLRPYLP